MPDKSQLSKLRIDPAKFKVGKASAARLAAMSGLAADKLAGISIGDIVKKFPHQIDPQLLLFRRVCGQVVKTDPVTGIDYPVPFATVQVEDTDCSFLGYFPAKSPWSWFFPFRCRREVIATAKTDECGNFCVWIPRFDIDWVLRWRRERRCFPIIFERPDLRDLIDLVIPREIPDFPKPGPDPLPFDELDRGRLVARVAESFGRDVAVKVSRLQTPAGFGASTVDADAALGVPVLANHIRPPLSPEFKAIDAARKAGAKPSANGLPEVATLAARLAIDPKDIKAIDLRRYIGPFKRCYDVIFPEWTPIVDVPDITFRVLQDTNGDGVEEQIYGEGYFQVRWNMAGVGSPITLHAGPHAQAGPLCGPENIPCGNTPAIVMAGRLPVTGDPAVFDSSAGYAVRTNRPHPSGLYVDPLPLPAGQSPLSGVLSLYGCNRTHPSATHYRLVYRYSADRGATFTPATPFTGMTWPLFRLNGSGIGEWHIVTPDVQGWYPIALPAGPNPWLPQDLLLDWPSYAMPNGLYMVTLQVGTGGSVTASSAEVGITVDNSAPTAQFTVETAFSASGPFVPINGVCPVVRRGVAPQDVYFRVTLDAEAAHLRSVSMTAAGCGSGSFVFESGSGGAQASPGSVTYRHWHTSPADNDQVLQAIYKLPASAAEGTYSFGGHVSGRGFSPSGYDGGHLAVPPWQYDPDQAHIYPNVAFSVFNSNP